MPVRADQVTSGVGVRPTARAAVLLVLAIAAGCGKGGEQPAQSSPVAGSSPPAGSAAAVTTPSARPDTAGAANPAGPDTAWLAAVQSLLDFYREINDRHYDAAYRRWARSGAASGQSPAEFRGGFASTVRVTLLVPEGASGAVAVDSATVPVELYSVVNASRDTQVVRRFAGSYTLRRGGGGWKIAGARLRDVAAPLPPPPTASPERVLEAYFQAIGRGELARAYTLWDDLGQASGKSLGAFAAGFVRTARDDVRLGKSVTEGAAGNLWASVPVALLARQRSGAPEAFCGTIDVHRANIPPWDSLGWRIGRAELRPLPARTDTATVPAPGCGA